MGTSTGIFLTKLDASVSFFNFTRYNLEPSLKYALKFVAAFRRVELAWNFATPR
jgi:hypothetical protein